jgi:uncharacterized protein (DUF1697 family)
VTVVGAAVQVEAAPEAYLGERDGSPVTVMAEACCELRWNEADRLLDRAFGGAESLKGRADAVGAFAAEVYAAGRVAGARPSVMERRLIRRLKPLLDDRVKEAPALVRALPYDFAPIANLMDALDADTRKHVATNARVTLRSMDRLHDEEYLTLATEYELLFPLEHQDRRRAMACLERGTPADQVANAIKRDRAKEAQARVERERRVAAAAAARKASLEALRQEEEQRAARARAWKPSAGYRSPYSTSSYVAAPSSYNSYAYYSNQAFYSRLNRLSGGGSYRVTASGVTYRR